MAIKISQKAGKAAAAGMAVMLGAAGAMGTAGTAFADEQATITATKMAASGKYNVYQIMTGVVSDESAGTAGGTGGKLSDAKVNTDNYSVVKATIDSFVASYNTGKEDADKITAITWNESSAVDKANSMMDAIDAINQKGAAQDFANDLAAALEAGAAESTPTAKAAASGTASSGKLSFTDLDTGYYIVVSDSDDAGLAEGEAMTSAILTVLGSNGTTITGKQYAPTITKTVKDANAASTAFDVAFSEIADSQLKDGDIDVTTYQLVGTLPSNVAEFDVYKYSFVDQLPTGMTTTKTDVDDKWNVSVKMYKDGDTTKTTDDNEVDVTSSFTSSVEDVDVDSDETAETSTITWACADVTALDGFNSATRFVLEYTPKLSQNTKTTFYDTLATLANPQLNSAHLTYSNNPYTQGNGTTDNTTTDTPDDDAKLYSYNLEIKKVDKDNGALTGAKFTLTDADGNTIGNEITATDDGTFDFTGLASDIEYTLTETTVPSGKKAISPIKFKITATKATDGKTVTAISATETADPSNAATLTQSDATVTATITNLDGVNMPLTGAEGVAVLVLAGGAVLALSCYGVARNRKKEDEQA